MTVQDVLDGWLTRLAVPRIANRTLQYDPGLEPLVRAARADGAPDQHAARRVVGDRRCRTLRAADRRPRALRVQPRSRNALLGRGVGPAPGRDPQRHRRGRSGPGHCRPGRAGGRAGDAHRQRPELRGGRHPGGLLPGRRPGRGPAPARRARTAERSRRRTARSGWSTSRSSPGQTASEPERPDKPWRATTWTRNDVP